MSIITKMCRKCLEGYEWKPPAFRVFGEACHCCLNPMTTVFIMSGEMIDRLNEEDEKDAE